MKFRRLVVALSMVLLATFSAAHALTPPNPLAFVTSVLLGSNARDIAIRDNLAYVGTKAGMSIVDISNPAAPVLRGSVVIDGSGGAEGIDVKLPYAYLASRDAGLNIVDVSNPDAPQILSRSKVSGQAYDVVVKDNIAYVASFGGGNIQLFDVTNKALPKLLKTIGLLKWSDASQDATNLAKMRAGDLKAGNALVTGLFLTGNILMAVDWGYGRVYYFNVTNTANPVFAGTHYAPFTFKVEADPARDIVYLLSAYSSPTGLYTVPLSMLGPDRSSRYDTCAACQFIDLANGGYGGIGLAPTSPYVLATTGGKTELYVINAFDTADVKMEAFTLIGKTAPKSGDTIGVASKGDYIFVAAGALGLRVYVYPPLSQ